MQADSMLTQSKPAAQSAGAAIVATLMGGMRNSMGAVGSLQAMDTFLDKMKTLGPNIPVRERGTIIFFFTCFIKVLVYFLYSSELLTPLALCPQPPSPQVAALSAADNALLAKFKRMASFANDPLGGQAGDGYFNFGDGSESDCNSYLDQYLSQCNHMTPQLVGMLQTSIETVNIDPSARGDCATIFSANVLLSTK
jgi:hypothetical protein